MTLEVGARAPEFTLTGIDGRSYSLGKALESGPLALVFFKSSCGTCDLTFPYLNRLGQAYEDGRWRIWAIAQDPPDAAREYARRFGVKYPVMTDGEGYPVSQAYDPPATPTIFLVDGDGTIAFASHGFSKSDLNELSASLAGRLGLTARLIAQKHDGHPDFKPG